MLIKVVRKVITTCLGVKEGETLLIVCDDGIFRLAKEVYDAGRRLGVNALLLCMRPTHVHGEEPPGPVAEALKAADAALLMTTKSLSHTRARKEACKKYGTRVASLPGVTKDMFTRAIDIDYRKLSARIAKELRLLFGKSRITVSTKAGTHLEMSIKGRAWMRDDGIYTKPGSFGNLPAGELCIAPVEGATNGVIVIDGSAPLVGRIRRPVRITVKNGYIQHMPIPAIRKVIDRIGKPARNIAEFGIGLNPKAIVTGRTLEDEKALNTVHIAIGNNVSFGGRVDCPCHLDFVLLNPSIYADGARLFSSQNHLCI
ncbi:MAG: aminopeptidase [Candidatus Omnitrophota bacterium]